MNEWMDGETRCNREIVVLFKELAHVGSQTGTKKFQSTDHWFWTLFEKKRKNPVNNNNGFGMRTRKLTEKIFQWVDHHYSSRHTHLMSSLASSPLKKRKKHVWVWLPEICNLFSVNLSAQGA